jgi:hypothetical protein
VVAPVAAIKEKGVLSGNRIERGEVGLPGEPVAASRPTGCGSLFHNSLAVLQWPGLRKVYDQMPELKALDPERPIREADMADNELLPRPSSASAQWQQPRAQSKLQ